MTAVDIAADDLAPFADIAPAKAEAMIADALAMAARVAPCINDDDFAYPQAALAIIRGAILRWNEAGTGAVTQMGAGPFQQSIDTTRTRRSMFWPSEITDLQQLCQDVQEKKAFSVDTAPPITGGHAPWCSLYFGASYCSCGFDIAGFPLYEVGL